MKKGKQKISVTAQSLSVQSTALNGAQVDALVQLANNVASGLIPIETAKQIAGASFPLVSEETIDDMFAPLSGFKQKKPEAAASVDKN